MITADKGVNGIAPPVYPVPPPLGIIVSSKAIHSFTMSAISSSVSGFITTKGYSTLQSVASVTWDTLARPSNWILCFFVWRLKREYTRFLNFFVFLNSDSNVLIADNAAVVN